MDASKPDGTAGPIPDSGGSRGSDASAPARHDAGAPKFIIGAACKTASDCAPGLDCLPSSSKALDGDGPANGLCTVSCAVNGEADCDAIDTGSVCIVGDAAKAVAYCYERCQEGTQTTDTPKCHDRSDMACAPNPQDVGYCAPTCANDAACGTRKCDPLSGLCSDSVSLGTGSIGAACDPTGTTNTCDGACLTVGAGTPSSANSACTRVCSLGATTACGPATSMQPTATCIPLIDQNEGMGDVGACAELCNCDADCQNPDFVCHPLPASLGYGMAGGCAPKLDASNAAVEGISCEKLGGDSGPDAGEPDAAGPATKGASPVQKKANSSGCGCSLGGHAPHGGALAAIAALGLLAGRRRRQS